MNRKGNQIKTQLSKARFDKVAAEEKAVDKQRNDFVFDLERLANFQTCPG